MNRAKPHACYKRLETDAEFKSRLVDAGVTVSQLAGVNGEYLDGRAWDWRRMQRRIVEDVA